MSAKLAVQEGIKFLNEKVPDWLSRIDLDTLNISDCFNCVLGQLFGEYSNKKSVNLFGFNCGFNNTLAQMREYYGFTITSSSCLDYSFKDLTDEWIEQIKQLKEEKKEKESEVLKEEVLV